MHLLIKNSVVLLAHHYETMLKEMQYINTFIQLYFTYSYKIPFPPLHEIYSELYWNRPCWIVRTYFVIMAMRWDHLRHSEVSVQLSNWPYLASKKSHASSFSKLLEPQIRPFCKHTDKFHQDTANLLAAAQSAAQSGVLCVMEEAQRHVVTGPIGAWQSACLYFWDFPNYDAIDRKFGPSDLSSQTESTPKSLTSHASISRLQVFKTQPLMFLKEPGLLLLPWAYSLSSTIGSLSAVVIVWLDLKRNDKIRYIIWFDLNMEQLLNFWYLQQESYKTENAQKQLRVQISFARFLSRVQSRYNA